MIRLSGIPGLFVEAVQALGEGIVGGLQDHGDPVDRHAAGAVGLFASGGIPRTEPTWDRVVLRVAADDRDRVIEDQAAELRHFKRAYGRAAATIGEQRAVIARLRSQRRCFEDGFRQAAEWKPDLDQARAEVAKLRRTIVALRAATPQSSAGGDGPSGEAEAQTPPAETDPADTVQAGDNIGSAWWDARLAGDPEDVCDRLAGDETRFRCSRGIGHHGQHVATAGQVVVWVWPNPDLLTADEQAAIAEGDPDATWLPDRGWCPPPTQPLLNGRPVSPAIVEWDRLQAVVEAARALVNWWAGHGMRGPDLDDAPGKLWAAVRDLDGAQADGAG